MGVCKMRDKIAHPGRGRYCREGALLETAISDAGIRDEDESRI